MSLDVYDIDATADELARLRSRTREYVAEQGQDKFNRSDLDRIQNNDQYANRFFKHVAETSGNQVDNAFKMIKSTIHWRKECGTDNVSQDQLKESLKDKGVLHCRNSDKDGKKLLVFTVRRHFKGAEPLADQKTYLIYTLERLERESGGDKITLVFDCAGCGLKNIDMEFVQYMIGLFNNYYPFYLNYILVFEMPWVLNAAFKVIKSWLPAAAVKIIKFVNKTSMSEYVEDEQRLVAWGGTDDWEYEFVPEKVSNKDSRSITPTFPEPPVQKSSPNQKSNLISVTPNEEIKFVQSSNGELFGKIQIQNTSKEPIVYKIKTTSPEKYRVRPSMATLAPNGQSTIEIYVYSSHAVLARDKFLITALVVKQTDLSSAQMSEIMKTSPPGDKCRLKCNLEQSQAQQATSSIINNGGIPSAALSSSNDPMDTLTKKVTRISHNQEEMLATVLYLKTMLHVLLILMFFLICDKFYSAAFPSNSTEQSCNIDQIHTTDL